jgi:hypothetical protein
MPRPSPEQRKKIEANRVIKHKIKADMDARDAQTFKRVQTIIDGALDHSRKAKLELPDLIEIMQKLERAYQLALATSQPGHAVAAAMAQAKLRGFIVDQQITAIGAPSDFSLQGDIDEVREHLVERLSERLGSRKARKMIEFLERLRKEPDDAIERDE